MTPVTIAGALVGWLLAMSACPDHSLRLRLGRLRIPLRLGLRRGWLRSRSRRQHCLSTAGVGLFRGFWHCSQRLVIRLGDFAWWLRGWTSVEGGEGISLSGAAVEGGFGWRCGCFHVWGLIN
jgi:hypothetical protein